MPAHIFQQVFHLTIANCNEVLETVVMSWTYLTCDGNPHVFQPDSSPSQFWVIQELMATILHGHTTLKMRPDLNPFHKRGRRNTPIYQYNI